MNWIFILNVFFVLNGVGPGEFLFSVALQNEPAGFLCTLRRKWILNREWHQKEKLNASSQSGVRLQIKHGFKLSPVCHSVNTVPLFCHLWENHLGAKEASENEHNQRFCFLRQQSRSASKNKQGREEWKSLSLDRKQLLFLFTLCAFVEFV